jgi:peptidyl-prolyl cis-trans isomerase C
MQATTIEKSNIASINGIALHAQDATLTADELRQRACSELLRQAAMTKGLLSVDDMPCVDGILSELASSAVETLLETSLTIPDPSKEECRRHHAAHQANYSTGERILVRHVLFAVTQGVDVSALRSRAETTLLDVRCHDGKSAEDAFAKAASTLSNCPSGAEGGNLGWLIAADCAPEFAKELFGHPEVGVLPRLVHSRFGLHIVEILAREPGVEQPFESVRGAVSMALRQKSYITALRQYLSLLAGEAVVVGIDLEAASTALVQ